MPAAAILSRAACRSETISRVCGREIYWWRRKKPGTSLFSTVPLGRVLRVPFTIRGTNTIRKPEAQGCDAIVAQGFEAGGHRGMFLTDDISTQIGTLSLLPQVVDAVKVPVIAAGASRQHLLLELQRYN
jgi:hypothetical protein